MGNDLEKKQPIRSSEQNRTKSNESFSTKNAKRKTRKETMEMHCDNLVLRRG